MYICLNNGDETEKIIKKLQARNHPVDIDRHETSSWLNIDTSESSRYHAYFDNFMYSAIIIFDRLKKNQDILIPLKLISTIYEL